MLSINSTNTSLFTTIHLFATTNVPTLLQALLAASSIFSLLPLVLLLLAILVTLFFSIVAFRLIPSTRQVAELADKNATLQREFDGCKEALDALAEESDHAPVVDAKASPEAEESSPQSPSPILAIDSETESERVQALEARLDFLRDSCKIMMAQKNDMLAQKDESLAQKNELLAQKNADLATLKAQLAATCQTKDELLAEKDASCRIILAQKNEEIASRDLTLSQIDSELAAYKARLEAAHQAMTAIVGERDEAVARTASLTNELEKTRADYDDKITFLTTRIVDAETSAASLQTLSRQQESKISDILLKNSNLHVEIVALTKRLQTASRQRNTPSSPRYSFQSFISPRTSESESDSSFDSDRPSPSRWRRFTIRRARKSGRP